MATITQFPVRDDRLHALKNRILDLFRECPEPELGRMRRDIHQIEQRLARLECARTGQVGE